MNEFFINIFNISISASYLILAVLLLRPLLRRAPKWIFCLLWGIAALRLIMPFSIESALSLIPNDKTVPSGIEYAGTPAVDSGIPVIDSAVNPIMAESLSPKTYANSVNPMQIVLFIAANVWILGIIAILIYGAISYFRLYLKVRPSLRVQENVYFCDDIDTPFILGIFRPRIYIPSGMEEKQMEYVIRHENAHLRRRDHLWKPIGFALLAFYWFNPLVWVAYILLCRDIESACDEKVIRDMTAEDKKGYSEALLSCSGHRMTVMACPLAFGEVGVKDRIKSVLHYKKPALWILIASVLVSAVIAVCFLTSPVDTVQRITDEKGYTIIAQKQTDVTLAIDKNALPSDALSEGGTDFKKNEIVAYKNDTTTVYLRRIQYANEGNDNLYFVFDFDYTPSRDSGSLLYPYQMNEDGTASSGFSISDRTLRDDVTAFENAISVRGQGSGTQIAIYVSADVFQSAQGAMHLDIVLNQLIYRRDDADTASANGYQNSPYDADYIEVLKRRNPEYFGLDTSKGLYVYFSQFAENSYSLYLLSGKDGEPDRMSLWNTASVTADEMRVILSTYSIDPSDIRVIFFQHPLSSYMDIERTAEERIANVTTALGLDRPQDSTVFQTPPKLLISSGDYIFRATGGGFSWTYNIGGGLSRHIIADSPHPLNFKELPHIYYTNGKAPSGYAMLTFESKPTKVSVDIYDIKSEKLVKTVTVTDGILTLLDGEYLYDIHATWSSHRDYGGGAHYCFQTTEN